MRFCPASRARGWREDANGSDGPIFGFRLSKAGAVKAKCLYNGRRPSTSTWLWIPTCSNLRWSPERTRARVCVCFQLYAVAHGVRIAIVFKRRYGDGMESINRGDAHVSNAKENATVPRHCMP